MDRKSLIVCSERAISHWYGFPFESVWTHCTQPFKTPVTIQVIGLFGSGDLFGRMNLSPSTGLGNSGAIGAFNFLPNKKENI